MRPRTRGSSRAGAALAAAVLLVAGAATSGWADAGTSARTDAVTPAVASTDAVTHATRTTTLQPFHDVHEGDPFAAEILWLRDRGIVHGHADGMFHNLAAVTREAMSAFLYRTTIGGHAWVRTCGEAPFADVPVGNPFCGEIAWLARVGVSTGWDDGTFRPGQAVSREAMAAFLYRLAHGEDAPSCTEAPFDDVPAGHPFCGAIAWLADAGISSGWDDGTFRPRRTIERQAMAAFLFRFIDGGHVPTA